MDVSKQVEIVAVMSLPTLEEIQELQRQYPSVRDSSRITAILKSRHQPRTRYIITEDGQPPKVFEIPFNL